MLGSTFIECVTHVSGTYYMLGMVILPFLLGEVGLVLVKGSIVECFHLLCLYHLNWIGISENIPHWGT